VLELLELQPLEHVLVGRPETGGMSLEQKKRVSIGVELASNPAILFVDEPTTGAYASYSLCYLYFHIYNIILIDMNIVSSGLDSRAAQVVMRSIRRVAASGRSVVCTIHQPSYPIFSCFDALLLLRRGGQTVFFGPLGDNCENLVEYFERAPGVRTRPTYIVHSTLSVIVDVTH
jgi:ABC-type multidrug transport system ATPase subunit